MRLAILQDESSVLDLEANLGIISRAAAQAVASGADLLLTPELFVTGYAPKRIREQFAASALPELRARLAAISQEHRIGMLYSLPDHEQGNWYISATLIDAGGARVGHYRKVHLFGAEEKSAFSPADDAATVVDYGGIKVGMIICFDVEFPESVRAAANRGAQLLLVPTALSAGFDGIPTAMIPTRAMENQLYVAYANHSGVEGGVHLGGGSVVADPEGGVIARAGSGPELIFADIDPALITRARAGVNYARERRDAVYRSWGSGSVQN